MEAIESKDLLDQEFQWTALGLGSVPIVDAEFEAKFYSNEGKLSLVGECDNFTVDDPMDGRFRLNASKELLDSVFAETDTVTLIVSGKLPTSGVTPLCKRKVIKCH